MTSRTAAGRISLRLAALFAAFALVSGLIWTVGALAAKPVSPTFVDYAQCANGAPPTESLACPDGWINGILQASNSHYTEDQVTPQRAEVNIPAGAGLTGHTLTFTYQARKGSASTHAYDSLATWNWTQRSADRCQDLAAPDCIGGSPTTFPIPNDPQVLAPFSANGGATSGHMLPASSQAQCDAYSPNLGDPSLGTYPSRCFVMYGGTITDVSTPVHDCVATNSCDDPSVDDYASITVTYSVPSANRKVQLLFGGHLAVGSTGGPRTWGFGFGASNISGGPYHIKWTASDGASIGNRDNQIMGSAIIFQDTTIATQVKNDADDANIANGASVAIGTVAYDTATLSGATATAGGTVTYYVEKGDASCTTDGATSLGAKTVTDGLVPDSDNYPFSSAGTYYFWAVYSGDANNNTSTSGCDTELVVVDPNSPTLGTTPNPTEANIGDELNDTATLTGETADATGNITFYLFAPGDDCSDLATAVYSQVVAISGGAASTDGTGTGDNTATQAGIYHWSAYYEGDANNDPAESLCAAEPVDISPNVPDIDTTPNFLPNDTIVVSGLTADATGSLYVELQVGADAECGDADPAYSKTWDDGLGSNDEFTGNGTYETDNETVLIDETTVIRWCVTYSGDANNEAFGPSSEGEIVSLDFDPVLGGALVGFAIPVAIWALWSFRRRERQG